MTIDGENLQADSGLISGPVVAQYFGFFNGVPKEHYDHIVATAPFQDCNLLILAFVHTVQKNGIYIADFTNGRDDPNYPAKPGDMDIDRVKLVVKTARAKNPSLKILVSLGWGNNDAGLAAQTPGPFADSVCAIVQTLGLDGLDIDYESTDVTASQMLTLAQTLWLSLTKQGDAEARYRADHYSGANRRARHQRPEGFYLHDAAELRSWRRHLAGLVHTATRRIRPDCLRAEFRGLHR